jgi:hypothetical protein
VRTHVRALALAATLAAGSAHAQGPFSFAVIGDAPYFPIEEQGFVTILRELDAEQLAFVVHAGDIKRAAAPCSDALYLERKTLFDRSRHPLVYIPGDNEWTDCHASGSDPLERLAALRRIFYPDDESIGARHIQVERQSSDPRFPEYRENVRWTHGEVLFVGLNVPGSNNNLGRTPEMDAEHRHRMAAVFDWLDNSMQRAARGGSAGVVIFFHAAPGFGGKAYRRRGAPDGYLALRKALLTQVQRFPRPVLLVHGDEHRFRDDHPLHDPATGKPLARFTRVEVPGAPAATPVVVDVDPTTPGVFTVHAPESAAVFPDTR